MIGVIARVNFLRQRPKLIFKLAAYATQQRDTHILSLSWANILCLFVSLCTVCVCVWVTVQWGRSMRTVSLCLFARGQCVCVCIAHKVSVCVCVCEFRCNGGEACAQNNHCASGHPKETRHKLTLLYAICTKGGGMRGGGLPYAHLTITRVCLCIATRYNFCHWHN